jgi:hypothetical protein
MEGFQVIPSGIRAPDGPEAMARGLPRLMIFGNMPSPVPNTATMSFLICSFASPRSRTEKIQRWIAYLDELEQFHSHDAERVQTIGSLRSRAYSWLASHADTGKEPGG